MGCSEMLLKGSLGIYYFVCVIAILNDFHPMFFWITGIPLMILGFIVIFKR